MKTDDKMVAADGLRNIEVATTRTSSIDGEAGVLVIGGYRVEDLAPNSTVEELVWLLLQGALPTAERADEVRDALKQGRVLPPAVAAALRAACQAELQPIDALMAGLAVLRPAAATDLEQALAVVAAVPVVVASYARMRAGDEPVAAPAGVSHAAAYLYLLRGELPSAAEERALSTYLNTVCDHGLNASTFAARVAASTGTDLVSATLAALATLKGPLHGGAPGPVLDMIEAIGSAERAPAYLRAQLERGERIMGFGHRVYRTRDPRATVLQQALQELAAAANGRGEDTGGFLALAAAVEAAALEALAEHRPGRRLQTNVEFATALLLRALKIPRDLFTATFAVGRVIGWMAHVLEQRAGGQLLRPRARYVGPSPQPWLPLAARR